MKLIVDTESSIRLDRYIKRLYPGLTQGIIEKALRKSEIKINNHKVKAGQRVQKDDEVFISQQLLPHVEQENNNITFSKPIISLANKILTDYLLFETKNFIIINKPAGLATQGGSKISLSIDKALEYLNYIQKRKINEHYKLVHRLDKETSGILIIANDYASSIKLANAFQNRLIEKTYVAIVQGKPLKTEGSISNLIAKKVNTTHGKYYEAMQEDNMFGKLAITNYKILQEFATFALLELKPLTGRTHQLRLHTKLLGCSIVGDKKYNNNNDIMVEKNMFLHAKSIFIPESIFGYEVRIDSELPQYFLQHINKIIVSQ